MLLIHPLFSPITAIVKSLSGFLPLWQLSLEGNLYICCDWEYAQILLQILVCVGVQR
jgi:hypothetical protein